MKKGRPLKQNGSLNRRALRLITILSIVLGIVIILLYYTIEMYHIRERTHIALHEGMSYLDARTSSSGQLLPDIYYVYTDEMVDEDLLMGVEREMINYYLNNREKFPYEKIGHLSNGRVEVFFLPMSAAKVNQGESLLNGALLIYADVSFATDLVKTTTFILSAVMVVFTALLYGVERYTVRILDAKDESVKVFFANASHELKTPLMAIRGYADGISDNIVEPEMGCEVINHEVERMSSLINSILEVSKIDSGIVRLNVGEYDVREILYDVMQVIKPAAEQKHISVIFDFPNPIIISCDEDMLFSVFSNILTNSIRYAKNTISISGTQQVNPNNLKVSISNDGEPIREEDIAHIFDRFYKGAGGQTGIGMALSLEYVHLHHGDISVYIEDGKTVFEVNIQLRK